MKEQDAIISSRSENNTENYRNEFSQILELLPSGFLILNQEGLIIDSNMLAFNLFAINKIELLGRNFCELIDDDDLNKFQNAFKKALKSSEPQTAEIRVKGTGNNFFHSLLTFRFAESSYSKNRICFMSMNDFTSYQMKIELIKDSESRFEKMANTAPVMIWIADVEGLFSFVNKVWLDYSGKEIGDQLGMNWLKDVHPDDREKLLINYRKAFSSRQPFTSEFRFMGNEGKYEWVIIRGVPRLSSENIFLGFIGSCTNIHVQKEFEEKIKKVNTELVDINAAKDKFFSIISHDLRSPLGGLMGILEILADSYDSLEEDEKLEIINEAAASSKQTYALVENLLEWSRLQSGKISYEPEKIELLPLVKRLESLYNQNLKNKGINFIINFASDISVFADLKMTEAILRNLISNAIKFTNKDGTINVSSVLEGEYVLIKVKDTGVGIEKKDLSKLFRTDISYSTKGTEKESGTGLGLILCKELVEKQGGEIGVESQKAKGSTFYFSLPLVK